MTIFVSLAVSATMFPLSGTIEMSQIDSKVAKALVEGGVVSVVNPSHTSTIEAIRQKFGINLPIPERAPKVSVAAGDSILIIQALLPRLAEGEIHSRETVESAPISFRLWTVSN